MRNDDNLTLKIIKTDIWFANKGLSPIHNLTNDEAKFNVSAYHAQQATEKCIKVVLDQYYNVDTTTRRYREHKIPRLLQYLEECNTPEKPIPIIIPEIIYEKANEISSWEANMRYNIDYTLLRKSIKSVVIACNKMLKELKEKGFE